jgi:hypothetical protein
VTTGTSAVFGTGLETATPATKRKEVTIELKETIMKEVMEEKFESEKCNAVDPAA